MTGALASCAAPLVGLLAERWFGFNGAAARSESAEKDLANAAALGSALLFFCLVPWVGTLLVYTGKPRSVYTKTSHQRHSGNCQSLLYCKLSQHADMHD